MDYWKDLHPDCTASGAPSVYTLQRTARSHDTRPEHGIDVGQLNREWVKTKNGGGAAWEIVDSDYKGFSFSPSRQSLRENVTIPTKPCTIYTVTTSRLKSWDMLHLTLLPFPLALALKVLKKTMSQGVSVQRRIYWHLLLIYGPLLCSLSGLRRSFSSFIFREEPPTLFLRDRAQVSISFLSGKRRRERKGTRAKAKLRGIY